MIDKSDMTGSDILTVSEIKIIDRFSSFYSLVEDIPPLPIEKEEKLKRKKSLSRMEKISRYGR